MQMDKEYLEQLNFLQQTYGCGTHSNWVNRFRKVIEPLPESSGKRTIPTKEAYIMVEQMDLRNLTNYRFDGNKRYNHIYNITKESANGLMFTISTDFKCNVLLFLEGITIESEYFNKLFADTSFANVVQDISYSKEELSIVDYRFYLYVAQVNNQIVYIIPHQLFKEMIVVAQELEGCYGAIVRLRESYPIKPVIDNIMLPDVPIFDIQLDK